VGKFHNIKMGMGEHKLEISMYAIPIRGVNVVVGIKRLRTLGVIFKNYNELFMIFELEGVQYELGSFQAVIFHKMEKPLKKGINGILLKLYSMEVMKKDENILEELKEPWKEMYGLPSISL